MRKILTLATLGALLSAATACGSDDPSAANRSAAALGKPHVVVTTNILGDVVTSAFGDLIDVEVLMPAGADPHEFAVSSKQATSMEDADLLVVNGAGFEAGLEGVVRSVAGDGTPSFAFADHVEPLGEDPHVWTDPVRVAAAVSELSGVVGRLPGVDPVAAEQRAALYVAELTVLDADIEALLAALPAERRVLVTNHDVFGYFADRYGFTVAGAVVPSLTTNAEASAKELEALADLLTAQSVPVIFAETTQPTQLAEALAAQIGDHVQIVELFTESLGPVGSNADTYVGLMRTDAQLIADALDVAPTR